MPFPGSEGSVWAPDTWATDSWTEDSWAGASVAPPTPSATPGGGWRGTEEDVLKIERLLHQRGRIVAVASPARAFADGSVKNPVRPRKAKVAPEPEPIPTPSPVTGSMTCELTVECQIVGRVGMGSKDEAVALAMGLNDDAFLRMIWEN